MSRRAVAVVLTTGILIALMGWQLWRERQIAACQRTSGHWNGALSRCEPELPIILQRGIERS